MNGEFLIDHAWGQEPCTIADVHAYTPATHSISNGQVLPCDYSYDDAHVVMREMLEESLLDLHDKHLAAGSIGLHVGCSKEAARNDYGMLFSSASKQFGDPTSSREYILKRFDELYKAVPFRDGKIRHVLTCMGDLVPDRQSRLMICENPVDVKEDELQTAISSARRRFGKNAVMHAMSLKENATGMERNLQIGGHHA